VLTANGLQPGCIAFADGRIVSIEPFDKNEKGSFDFGDFCVLPGIVDSHVHVNEPGRTEWEGFATATKAAAAGGCTCIVDMPLNSIPATTNVDGLKRKREAARNQSLVDYSFWGGVVPGNAKDLLALAQNGVRGFKCFLSDSGVPEFSRVSEADLGVAMPLIVETGLPLLVHAELPSSLAAARAGLKGEWGRYTTYLASRPPQAEVEAIEMMIRLCRKHGCRVHIVHVSAAEALAPLRQAKSDGLPVTAETCPHYLYFAADYITDWATQFKCAPPIRDARNREMLWDALADGTVDLIATDHSPCPASMKRGDFDSAWGGISSLSVALPVVWTASRKRGFNLGDVCRWMSAKPASLAGLNGTKGEIAPGCDADFTVFDPDNICEITADRLHFRHACSPYIGANLTGEVKQVFVRGNSVYQEGQFATICTGHETNPRARSMYSR
jgi:allantoinase